MLCAHKGMPYIQFHAMLAKKREVSTYLEVGVCNGTHLKFIQCDVAVGVDPQFMLKENVAVGKKALHLLQYTSDAFFNSNIGPSLVPGGFDFAFLDGMHIFDYLLRDFYKAEKLCKKNGLISMHDCLPPSSEIATRERKTPAWTGDVWKIIPILKKYRPDLRITAVNCPPTGLVLISNLDPTSTVLEDKYLEIVDEFVKVESTDATLQGMYDSIELVDSAKILQGFDHALYFKI
jgi:hypothetical protein